MSIFLNILTVACSAASVAEVPGPAQTSPEDASAYGEAVARLYVCNGCHAADGVGAAGPTWKGLYGKVETLDDGTTVTVDEAYLRESILDPNAKVVEGFLPNIMPGDFGEKLSDS